MTAPAATGSGRVVRWLLSSAMSPMGALPSAPGGARAHVRQVLTEWGLPAVADDCELVVSELVTNALIAYAGPGGEPRYVNGKMPVIRVCVMSDARQVVLVEVCDEAAGVPGLRDVDPGTDEHGHGLHMVQTITRGQWGWTPLHGQPGKCVWAALPLPAPAPQPKCLPARSPAAMTGCRLLTAPQTPRAAQRARLSGAGAITARAARGPSRQEGTERKEETMTGLDTETAATPAPAFLELEITGVCNLTCTHCYADSGPRGGHGTMTAADWEQVIGQAAALGVRTVQFIGGEPTASPYFARLVRYALAAGLNVNVFSNLARRVTADLWELFASPGVSLSTSWYAADPAVHERITGSKTAWASTRANIAGAVRRGIPVRAAVIDGVAPGQDAAAAEAVLRAIGVTEIRVRPVQGAGRASAGGHENDPSELCGHCGTGRAAILPDGQLTPCVIGRWMHTGNVKETPIADILAGQAWRDALALVPRMADDCPPASDGNDCPPASNPTCAPSYCAPHTGDTFGVLVPLAQVAVRRTG